MNGTATKRLVLIGPVLPFRGGIAQHTTMLHRALAEQVELKTISFAAQYPGWLYPGQSDRDPAYAGYEESGVEYRLSSLNPLSWRAVLKECLEFDPDNVVIPWWTVFWAPCFWYLARNLRRHGIKVVFLCHNVIEHESSAWKAALTRRVLRQGDRFVVHTREDEANLQALLPDAKVRVCPHPVYEQFPQAKGTLQRRAALELLFFGFIRPYKGLDILIEALGELKDRDIFLTIAGEFWEGEGQIRRRIAELGLDDKIEIVSGYVSDEKAAEYFERCDVVVLPYRSATGSGVVPLAYHYGKPVIVSKVGGLPDVVDECGTGFLVPPEQPAALAKAIRRITPDVVSAMKDRIGEKARALTWKKLAETLCRDNANGTDAI